MLSQIMPSPNASPVLNNGGWVYSMAILIFALGAVIALLVVFGYMRFAPRFQRDEGAARVVRAERIQPGKDAPRRPVKIVGATVAVAAPVAVAPVAVAPEIAALAAVPAAPSAPPAPVAAAPQPATVVAQAPEAVVAPPTPESAPAAAPREHKEVVLDQETFDRVLAELLEKGTDRRVAEGQARRAAMIAARKKAEG